MSSNNNLANQSKITHNTNQLTNNVIQYIQSANNYLDLLIATKTIFPYQTNILENLSV